MMKYGLATLALIESISAVKLTTNWFNSLEWVQKGVASIWADYFFQSVLEFRENISYRHPFEYELHGGRDATYLGVEYQEELPTDKIYKIEMHDYGWEVLAE